MISARVTPSLLAREAGNVCWLGTGCRLVAQTRLDQIRSPLQDRFPRTIA
jgi:hypothetical protein